MKENYTYLTKIGSLFKIIISIYFGLIQILSRDTIRKGFVPDSGLWWVLLIILLILKILHLSSNTYPCWRLMDKSCMMHLWRHPWIWSAVFCGGCDGPGRRGEVFRVKVSAHFSRNIIIFRVQRLLLAKPRSLSVCHFTPWFYTFPLSWCVFSI